jgi:hypothetical protein
MRFKREGRGYGWRRLTGRANLIFMGRNDESLERRRHTRCDVALKISFNSIENMENMILGSALNLSRSGMFIRTGKVIREGDRVEIELPVLGEKFVRVQGVVRHARQKDGHPYGLGIEFDKLEGPALKTIEDLLSRTGRPP